MSEPTTQTSYDRVAGEYAHHFLNELDHKPFDRELLDKFAVQLKTEGRVCDLGCGPGQIARYLYQQGVDVIGVDLSPQMVEHAQKLHPNIPFQQADMRSLPFENQALAGIAAFYSIIHIPRTEVPMVLQELRRVLKPTGLLLLSFHIGDHVVHLDEWWGEQVSLDFAFFTSDELKGYLTASGFSVEQADERPPYPTEHPSQRGYILARRTQV